MKTLRNDMPDKFIAWDDEGVKVWAGMATDENFAEQFAIADHPELKGQKLTIKKVIFVPGGEVGVGDMAESLPQTVTTDANPREGDTGITTLPEIMVTAQKKARELILSRRTRKERSDKDKPRGTRGKRPEKPAESKPKERRKPDFFVFMPNAPMPLTEALTENEAKDCLAGAPMECTNLRLIRGHEVKFTKRIQFSFKV